MPKTNATKKKTTYTLQHTRQNDLISYIEIIAKIREGINPKVQRRNKSDGHCRRDRSPNMYKTMKTVVSTKNSTPSMDSGTPSKTEYLLFATLMQLKPSLIAQKLSTGCPEGS